MIEKDTYSFSRFLATKKSLTDVLSRQKTLNTLFHLCLGLRPDVGSTVREVKITFPFDPFLAGAGCLPGMLRT